MTMLADLPSAYTMGLTVQFNTAALSSSAATAGHLTGAGICIFTNTGATPGTYTTRTVAQMALDSNLVVGQSWLLIIVNTVITNAITLAGGTNVTIAGTATIAGVAARLFSCVYNSPTLMTFTGLAISLNAAAA